MRRIPEAEAYRAWHREQKVLAQYRRDLARIRRDIEGLELDMAIAARDAEAKAVNEWTVRLRGDRAFLRALSRYWGHTPRGWAAACGIDGRMRDLLRTPGWEVLRQVIRRVRAERGWTG